MDVQQIVPLSLRATAGVDWGHAERCPHRDPRDPPSCDRSTSSRQAQRGNHREPVFWSEADRLLYLALLKEAATDVALDLLGYCLMDNHMHAVPIPHTADALAHVFGRTHGRYALLQNGRALRPGHLWQGPFKSCPLDELHLCRALRYVDLNPRRARLVSHPADWPWSSARAHLGGEDPTGLLNLDLWRELWPGNSWEAYLMADDALADVAPLRYATQTGRPWGDESFLDRLEAVLGRPVRPRRANRADQAA